MPPEEPEEETGVTDGGLPDAPGVSLPGYKLLDGVADASSDLVTNVFGEAAGAQTEDFFGTLLKDSTTMAAGMSCTPQSGMELREMVEDNTRCTIITLLPGKLYTVALPDDDADMTVSGRKVIIGNPIAMPTIDGADSIRLFHIVAGGNLDLQFVRTFRGGGELVGPFEIPVLRGGTALVELGGRFSAFGVIFTNAPPVGLPAILIAPDISRAVRVFGGQVFVTGGIVTITLSHFWVLQPGVLLREIYVVGADMLVVAGVAVLSGVTFTNSQMFLNGFGAGFQLAVLGGVLVCSGVTFTLNFLAINASGAGILTFLGGGVGIFSGCVWNANLGVASHFGSGLMIFEGAGVLVISGAVFVANLGVAIECGTGVMISLGAGTLTATGVTQALSAGVDFYAGSGVLNWVGAGSAVLVGFTESRNVGVAGVYGIGGTMAVGAGALIVVGSASADNYGVASIVLIGGNFFLGAGVFVEIGSPLAKNVGVLFAYFLGFDAFVGAGTAVVRGSPSAINLSPAAYVVPPVSQYFINGEHIPAAYKNFNVKWDKEGNKSVGHALITNKTKEGKLSIVPKGPKTQATLFQDFSFKGFSFDGFGRDDDDIFGMGAFGRRDDDIWGDDGTSFGGGKIEFDGLGYLGAMFVLLWVVGQGLAWPGVIALGELVLWLAGMRSFLSLFPLSPKTKQMKRLAAALAFLPTAPWPSGGGSAPAVRACWAAAARAGLTMTCGVTTTGRAAQTVRFSTHLPFHPPTPSSASFIHVLTTIKSLSSHSPTFPPTNPPQPKSIALNHAQCSPPHVKTLNQSDPPALLFPRTPHRNLLTHLPTQPKRRPGGRRCWT